MARIPKSLRTNRKKLKSPGEKILIVCEGEKTEPNYFNEIARTYKLNSAKVQGVVVSGECDSSPDKVFKHAKALAQAEAKTGSPFDKVYCVMDKDNHETFHVTREAINKARGNIYQCIYSIPSFEHWLLLHFMYSRKSYESQPGNSVGRQVIKDLKKHPGMEAYEKAAMDVFSVLGEDKLATAITHSKRLLSESEADGSENPSNKVHILIEQLQKMKK